MPYNYFLPTTTADDAYFENPGCQAYSPSQKVIHALDRMVGVTSSEMLQTGGKRVGYFVSTVNAVPGDTATRLGLTKSMR